VPPDECSPDTCASVPSLPEGIGLSLIRASRAHRALAGSLLADIGLHPGQEAMILALAGGEMTPGQLAAQLGVEPPTITKMIRRMEAAGLVESSASVVDRRSRTVQLSDAGRAVARRADEVWARLEAVTTDTLTPAQCAQLERLLTKVTERLHAEGGVGSRSC
jgi:DNA-binding MarR family transcriptional regulator